MNLEKTLEACLVISLKRNENGRLRLFKNKFTHNLPLTIIEGVDGLAIDVPEIWKDRPGTYGCLLSHIKAIRFARDNKLRNVLILEDDVRFIKEFQEKLSQAMSELPDNWDTLWLGGAEEIKSTPYSNSLCILNSCWGGYGYILRHTVYDFFIEELEKRNVPCDTFYSSIQKDFNSFKTSKPFVLHSHISSVRISADRGMAI